MRFSNKISNYSRISVPPLAGQKSPAEQLFVGGVFALSACYIGNVAGLLHCLRVSALFALRFFCLVFYNRFGRSICVRCFFRLQVWSPAWPHALSPTWSRPWSPTSTSMWHWLVGLIHISGCKPSWLHVGFGSAHTFGAKLSLPSTHSAALGRYASAFSTLHSRASVLEASTASTLHCRASVLEASTFSTLHSRASVLEASTASTLHRWASALETSTASTLHSLASVLEASAASTLHSRASALEASTASALPAPNVLIRTLAERAVWTSWSPEIVRLYGFEVCPHSWPAGHPASQSWTAATTSTASPSLFVAATATTSALTGKSLAGQNRHCQCNNDRCFDCCLFHFRFLSLRFHFAAFLSPILGSFYRDSGAGGKKVTPGENFSGKIFVLLIENGRLRKYQSVSAAIYFTSMFRLSCKSGIKTKKNLQTG